LPEINLKISLDNLSYSNLLNSQFFFNFGFFQQFSFFNCSMQNEKLEKFFFVSDEESQKKHQSTSSSSSTKEEALSSLAEPFKKQILASEKTACQEDNGNNQRPLVERDFYVLLEQTQEIEEIGTCFPVPNCMENDPSKGFLPLQLKLIEHVEITLKNASISEVKEPKINEAILNYRNMLHFYCQILDQNDDQ
jgi:hypothetical protein